MFGRMANKLIQLLGVRGIQDTQCGLSCSREMRPRTFFHAANSTVFSFDFETMMIAKDLGYEIAKVRSVRSHQEGSKVLLRDALRRFSILSSSG